MSNLFSKLANLRKKDVPEGLWLKCPSCESTLYRKKVEENLSVCTGCQHHFPITARRRIELICDPGSFEEMDASLESNDPLKFVAGDTAYAERLKATQKKTGEKDAAITGLARLGEKPVVLAVTDSSFMMGSMGCVVGEKLTRAVEKALELKRPLISISASGGGARMHEAPLSLMQMTKTSVALGRFHEAGGLYISVLCHPTMGGVMASYAALGDIVMAEPRALVGFAGPRVIMETIRQTDLPAGFQSSEFMMEHGMIDMIVHRAEMRDRLIALLGYLVK
ncbi:MAG: acetyl-CoA carboxylase, carboxyltransferase subunit beta [Planctomycetota bacterium]